MLAERFVHDIPKDPFDIVNVFYTVARFLNRDIRFLDEPVVDVNGSLWLNLRRISFPNSGLFYKLEEIVMRSHQYSDTQILNSVSQGSVRSLEYLLSGDTEGFEKYCCLSIPMIHSPLNQLAVERCYKRAFLRAEEFKDRQPEKAPTEVHTQIFDRLTKSHIDPIDAEGIGMLYFPVIKILLEKYPD